MTQARFIVNVEAAVINDAGEYLMVIRGEEESHAAGMLSMPGGKVELSDIGDDILEVTARREVLEETGITVSDDITYVESKLFVADDGDPVVDVVMLCRYQSGDPVISDPGEVATIRWMAATDIDTRPQTPPWTRQSIARAERIRGVRQP
jgi:8-oxo-dGTP diphosphatase